MHFALEDDGKQRGLLGLTAVFQVVRAVRLRLGRVRLLPFATAPAAAVASTGELVPPSGGGEGLDDERPGDW